MRGAIIWKCRSKFCSHLFPNVSDILSSHQRSLALFVKCYLLRHYLLTKFLRHYLLVKNGGPNIYFARHLLWKHELVNNRNIVESRHWHEGPLEVSSRCYLRERFDCGTYLWGYPLCNKVTCWSWKSSWWIYFRNPF